MLSQSQNHTLFEVFGRSGSDYSPDVNRDAFEELEKYFLAAGRGEGRVILLRSPRAGYGKTVLLQKLKEKVGERSRFLAVEPSCGGRIDGEIVLESVLRQLSVVYPASGGLTELDFLSRQLFAVGLRPLLMSGEIPSHDREGALYAIENRPIETFDFHHQQAATAHWTQSNFEVLGPRLSAELSEMSGNGLRECSYWIDLLFKYATTSPEKVERNSQLSEAVLGELKGSPSSEAEEKLQGLLGLMGLIQPTALVFDETEGLSNQPETGLKVAAFIVQLRQACPRLTVILSVNQDVWQTGFDPLMPGGLRDRLTEHVVDLKDLTREAAASLLQTRFGSRASELMNQPSIGDSVYARDLMRKGLRETDGQEEMSVPALGLAGVSPPPMPLEGESNLVSSGPEAEAREVRAEVFSEESGGKGLEGAGSVSEESGQQGSPFDVFAAGAGAKPTEQPPALPEKEEVKEASSGQSPEEETSEPEKEELRSPFAVVAGETPEQSGEANPFSVSQEGAPASTTPDVQPGLQPWVSAERTSEAEESEEKFDAPEIASESRQETVGSARLDSAAVFSSQPELRSGEEAKGTDDSPFKISPSAPGEESAKESGAVASVEVAVEEQSPFEDPVAAAAEPGLPKAQDWAASTPTPPSFAESPVTAVQSAEPREEHSPFTAAAAPQEEPKPKTGEEDSAKVEELLNQFKQRFGQPGD